jgi:hypothetical protein
VFYQRPIRTVNKGNFTLCRTSVTDGVELCEVIYPAILFRDKISDYEILDNDSSKLKQPIT